MNDNEGVRCSDQTAAQVAAQHSDRKIDFGNAPDMHGLHVDRGCLRQCFE